MSRFLDSGNMDSPYNTAQSPHIETDGLYLMHNDSLEGEESILVRITQEFEQQLIQVYNELTSGNGLDSASAEYEILSRLCANGGLKDHIDEADLDKFVIDGRLRRDEAIRAVVIQRELDSLHQKGVSLVDSVSELILRLNSQVDRDAQKKIPAGTVVKKKKLKEYASLCAMTKNKSRVHRRPSIGEEDSSLVMKESFQYDGELPRPTKKLRRENSMEKDLQAERKKIRKGSSCKGHPKYSHS